MCRKIFVLSGLAIFLVGWCGGCHGGAASSTDAAAAPATEPVAIPIPPDSPFAKIKMDMGMKEVTDLLRAAHRPGTIHDRQSLQSIS